MSLAKLTITPKDGTPIPVQFNPASYSTSKSVTWSDPKSQDLATGKKGAGTNRKLNAPAKVFGGGGSRTISFDLFFDVTEPVERGSIREKINDVRVLTNQLVKLTQIKREGGKEKPPPTCTITWGKADGKGISDLPFKGKLTNLTQKFTLFDSDGNPLRAEVGVTFTEAINEKEELKETDPDFTTRVVKRGDTLSTIAAQMYSNPALWRVIADANDVDDARIIQIGRTLHIPKVG